MSAAKNDGGPAFPIMDCSQNNATGETISHQFMYSGMSLRDYFAAHAPAEPQPWFRPVMGWERPTTPKRPFPWSQSDQDEWFCFREGGLDVSDIKSPIVREYAERYEAAEDAMAAWDKQCAKERCVQWPYAWADAMLKERAK